jgi:hypothetical protein
MLNWTRVLLAIALALVATSASALPVSFDVTITLGDTTVGLEDITYAYTPTDEGDPDKGGTYTLLGDLDLGSGVLQDWSSMFDADPFVTNTFVVQNNTASPQTYVITVTSPVSPALGSTLMLGSVGLTLTNTTDTSASLTSNSPNPVYTALLDGSPVATLFPDPYSLSCGTATCSNTGSTDFGMPVMVAGPGVGASMGIRIEFELSPGDSGGVTSVFYVEAPEPAATALLALALGAGLLMERRPRGA